MTYADIQLLGGSRRDTYVRFGLESYIARRVKKREFQSCFLLVATIFLSLFFPLLSRRTIHKIAGSKPDFTRVRTARVTRESASYTYIYIVSRGAKRDVEGATSDTRSAKPASFPIKLYLA